MRQISYGVCRFVRKAIRISLTSLLIIIWMYPVPARGTVFVFQSLTVIPPLNTRHATPLNTDMSHVRCAGDNATEPSPRCRASSPPDRISMAKRKTANALTHKPWREHTHQMNRDSRPQEVNYLSCIPQFTWIGTRVIVLCCRPGGIDLSLRWSAEAVLRTRPGPH